ncbi:hypothetical protein IAI10_19255 [Clostridium sp. 19966]|uniref:DUF5316 family protein n=1 Tax=Clostridium sp. 19966 TaxID=2768166 RepID=UPI0028DEDBA7|nr:DUF5316 family protein [Clostridium sp. 19966]MDT8718798.1 hypothetical protein [Clostridium sp. 19966]
MYKKSLFFSILALIILLTITALIFNLSAAGKVAGSIGLIGMLLSAVFYGILGSGDRIRLNYSVENKKESADRQKAALILLILSLPYIVVAIIILGFIN